MIVYEDKDETIYIEYNRDGSIKEARAWIEALETYIDIKLSLEKHHSDLRSKYYEEKAGRMVMSQNDKRKLNDLEKMFVSAEEREAYAYMHNGDWDGERVDDGDNHVE